MTYDLCDGRHSRRRLRQNRIANIDIGHLAIDGGGYAYLNPVTGHTSSGVVGFTYNFGYPDTQVQSGYRFPFRPEHGTPGSKKTARRRSFSLVLMAECPL